jgi:hypothetical protein
MHWSTYERLRRVDVALQERWVYGMAAMMSRFDRLHTS